MIKAPRRRITRPLLALACLGLLGTAGLHAQAQSVVPLSYSVAFCDDGTGPGKLAEVTGASAHVECTTNVVSDDNEYIRTTSSGSTYYPGAGLPARVEANATSDFRTNSSASAVASYAFLSYYLKVDEKLPPPFDPGSVPLILHVTATIETAGTIGSVGVALRGPGNGGYSFYEQAQSPNFKRSWALDLAVQQVPRIISGFTKEAFCYLGYRPGASSTSCSAMVDPDINFDQATFDAVWGNQTFALLDHYQLIYSPTPEPASLALVALGLAALAAKARRPARD